MKNIVKTFVEIYTLDMEGRNGKWEAVDMTHEEAIKELNGWNNAVRTVEKTFNTETFKTTEKVLRLTEKDYEGAWTWNGKIKEMV